MLKQSLSYHKSQYEQNAGGLKLAAELGQGLYDFSLITHDIL
jgi:hypothetical protein